MSGFTGSPFTHFLNMRIEEHKGTVRVTLPQHDKTIGAPGRLHGGAVASLLEAAAFATLHARLAETPKPTLKPISMTVDYLREGAPAEAWAEAEIVRLGRRIANIRVTAWQDERTGPIATAQLNVMIDRVPASA